MTPTTTVKGVRVWNYVPIFAGVKLIPLNYRDQRLGRTSNLFHQAPTVVSERVNKLLPKTVLAEQFTSIYVLSSLPRTFSPTRVMHINSNQVRIWVMQDTVVILGLVDLCFGYSKSPSQEEQTDAWGCRHWILHNYGQVLRYRISRGHSCVEEYKWFTVDPLICNRPNQKTQHLKVLRGTAVEVIYIFKLLIILT